MAQAPNPFSEDIFLHVLRDLDVRTLALSGLVCKQWKAQVSGISAEPHFYTAMSTAETLQQAVDEVFANTTAHAFRPNVAFLFATDNLIMDESRSAESEEANIKILDEALQKLPPDLCLVGCTGVGIVGRDVATGKVDEREPAQPEDGAPTPARGISLALARVAGAAAHGFLIKKKCDASEAMAQLKERCPDTSARSLRAVVVADVHTQTDHARVQSLLLGCEQFHARSKRMNLRACLPRQVPLAHEHAHQGARARGVRFVHRRGTQARMEHVTQRRTRARRHVAPVRDYGRPGVELPLGLLARHVPSGGRAAHLHQIRGGDARPGVGSFSC